MRPLSVLVADDEEDIRQLLEQWLKLMGHVVSVASNGTEALKLARGTVFDLVVTDILMPDGDGLMVIDGLRKTQPTARVLAISGGGRYLDSQEYLKMAAGFGADAALMKPFNREKFLLGLGRAMAPRPLQNC
jgi:CheY-like chemotaxis protein